MNIYESAEDYLERILMLEKKHGKVRSIDIALDMNYTKASVSRAVKNLKESEYITVDNGIIDLTPKGRSIATRIYDRHITLSNFFISLGIPTTIAIKDACKVEHDLSPETFEAIKILANQQKTEK